MNVRGVEGKGTGRRGVRMGEGRGREGSHADEHGERKCSDSSHQMCDDTEAVRGDECVLVCVCRELMIIHCPYYTL